LNLLAGYFIIPFLRFYRIRNVSHAGIVKSETMCVASTLEEANSISALYVSLRIMLAIADGIIATVARTKNISFSIRKNVKIAHDNAGIKIKRRNTIHNIFCVLTFCIGNSDILLPAVKRASGTVALPNISIEPEISISIVFNSLLFDRDDRTKLSFKKTIAIAKIRDMMGTLIRFFNDFFPS
jgi:hypothetical protein